MIFLKGIINGISSIINMFKMIWDIVMSIFETIGMVFRYLITIVNIVYETIATFPEWLLAFAIITISISIAYFLIGRNAGKSD